MNISQEEQRELTQREIERQNAFLGISHGLPGSMTPDEFEGLCLGRLTSATERYFNHPSIYAGKLLRETCQEMIDWLDGKLTP